MSCNLTSGIPKSCRDNAGGIIEVLLGSFPTGYVSNEWYETSGNTVIGISGLTLYHFETNKNTSGWVENIQANETNIGYEPVITMVFAKNDAEKSNAIKVLGQADLVAIIRDKNEKYWLVGPQNGLTLNGGSSSSGVALGDMNGWNITLNGAERYPAMEVSASIISGLLE